MSERASDGAAMVHRRTERARPARAVLIASVLAALAATAAAEPPVTLALFPFELEEFTADAGANGQRPSDIGHLGKVTDEVGRLLAQSGRYRLVDVSGADDADVTARSLHRCDGCDAAIARRLGAQQSFVGVVRRISRTEYTVRFRIRDAGTGAVVAGADSGLRMGADYSWDRGAIRLVRSRLLEGGEQQP